MGRCGTHTQINFLAGFVVRFNNVKTCLAQFWVNMGQNKEGNADKSSYFKVVSVILTLRGYVQLGYMVIHLVTHTLHCITLYITITHYTIYIVNIVIQLWLYRYIERFFYSLLVEYCENLCDSKEKRKVVIRFYFHFYFFFSFLFFIEKKK
ncbi:dubious [Schizosaccharomyces pombe]|uniref:Putative uncharacterized transmembrane protein C1235.17 n=1 Tax=Schizosaccharomyces pombe (strain 972 / ATCC 24843) TaxID=284812 RepID=YCYH_SCHPO|nr:uncharacterized protein SPCC1235.17 [Schizosaccharomyces pombe]G2TRT7.1 RecName: Full=Putative uncharacterized transmembrane protein C1235.17 [Schizosaccharomyces pombe 972h-]CCD31389.1 dubious [Schizosaccharomyces pombe]|eukprot:NP_001343179.1 uncharacterized protein SPCC1235.17 [Schizosaccharomyces pombe]